MLRAPRAHKVRRVSKVLPVRKVNLVLPVPRALKVLSVLKVLRANKAPLDLRVPRDLKVSRVLLARALPRRCCSMVTS